MFVDEAVVTLKAGDGGNGIIAFRREKNVPMGGPAGGNGGKGSDIIFKVDSGLKTLLDLKQKRLIKGARGENGKNKSMHGGNAEDVYIKVPPGTIVTNFGTHESICDLTEIDQEFMVAKGGRGGKGNKAFSTHANPAPNLSENGEPGEETKIKLELKLMADVGLVGLPSVGKSTLISVISSAKPKIAEYEFTTLSPNLGVVKAGETSFTVADLPGLIKGAHEGIGLGDKFLKHIERTKAIAHIIDMSRENPIEDYKVIEEELKLYSNLLKDKEKIIVANKMDMEISKENLKKFQKEYKNIKVYPISAIKKEGLNELLFAMKELIENYIEPEKEIDTNHKKYEFKEESRFKVRKEEDVYIIEGLTKLYKMSNLNTDEGIKRFTNTLNKIGVNNELEKQGINEEDIVRIKDFEFEYRK